MGDMTRGKWVVWGLEAGPGERVLHHTGPEDMLLFFRETLAILSDTGEPQGELTIEVQKGKYKDDLGILTHCLLVHASSRSFLDKSLCGSSLLGRVLPAGCPSHLPSRAPIPIHRSLIRTCPLTYLGRVKPGGGREGEGGQDGSRRLPGSVLNPFK